MDREMIYERFHLTRERILEIKDEKILEGAFGDYFSRTAAFVTLMADTLLWLGRGGHKEASLEELQRRNHEMYEDILPSHYEESYANPAYAVRELGEEYGRLLSFLYYELRSLIGFAYEGKTEEMVIRMELFVEIYGAFVYEKEDGGGLPEYEGLRRRVYWFAFDYAEMSALGRVGNLVNARDNFAVRIMEDACWEDVRSLYYYGEYVTENELEVWRFLADRPEETIALMADTYTEGYRKGFELAGKDLSKKKTAGIYYSLGFERMIRKALGNFRLLGLEAAVYRAPASVLYNPSLNKSGFMGANPNKQYDFDHKDDRALFLDKAFVSRSMEAIRGAFEHWREEAGVYAGPAVVETFGEKPFEPVSKPQALRLSRAQQELWVEYRAGAGRIQREYIKEEERSFTIIAFPVPEIGESFEEIFGEIIKINTLDYHMYQDIQQTLINALDQAEYCEIRGMGGNRTDLRVSLHRLENPEKETIFENCVADVNIPVGEVFTSPRLAGTTGTLHVSRVYLNGLEYKDLELSFTDGMIRDYSCANFPTEEENRAFIKENLLFHQKTLPMGEFAIGTNTTAYVAAAKYDIGARLPILIAEKMGPHFAVGDTCYSHAEEIAVFNPDGKEVVARDNEVSLLREQDVQKAYYNCHTDITIPYDELGALDAVTGDGERIPIIREGRFVLEGCGKLNEPFSQADHFS